MKIAIMRGVSNKPWDTIWVGDYLDTPSDVFVVTEEYYKENQQVLKKFLEIYKKSMQYTIDNPDEAAQIAVEYAIDGQDVQRNRAIIDIRNQSSVNEDTMEHGLGWLNIELLIKAGQVYQEIGLIKQPVDIEAIFTNELVKQLGE